MAAEMGYIIFSSAMWQHLEIQLHADEAAYILSILTATYTAGRLASALISLKVPPDFIISYHYAIILGALALLFFGRFNIKCIYAGNALLGKMF